MALSEKQVQTLRRSLNVRHVRTRETNGRELSYIEGWYAISEANRASSRCPISASVCRTC